MWQVVNLLWLFEERRYVIQEIIEVVSKEKSKPIERLCTLGFFGKKITTFKLVFVTMPSCS